MAMSGSLAPQPLAPAPCFVNTWLRISLAHLQYSACASRGTRLAADHFCSVNIVSSTRKALAATLWLRPLDHHETREYSESAVTAAATSLQFLRLPKFSCSFPARALPMLGSANSEIQWDTDHHVAKAIGNTLFCLSDWSMTQILSVSPCPDVGEGWARRLFPIQEMYILVPTQGGAPCPKMRDPAYVTCASWERSFQFSSVAQSSPTLCDPMNHSTPGLPVHHQLPEFTQTHIHRVSDAIQPSYPLSSPSPPAPNPSQHQSLFQ